MTIPEHELYESNLTYFRAVLRVLASDATAQCKELWGAPNVPWEISEDVIHSGTALLKETHGRISAEQRKRIEALIGAMRCFPSKWRENKLSYEENVNALQDPFWTPLRATAMELLSQQPYVENDNGGFADKPKRPPS